MSLSVLYSPPPLCMCKWLSLHRECCEFLRPIEAIVLSTSHQLFHVQRLTQAIRQQFKRALRHCLAPLVPFPAVLLDKIHTINQQSRKVVAILSRSIVLQALLHEKFSTTDLDIYGTRDAHPILQKHLSEFQRLHGPHSVSRRQIKEYRNIHHLHSIDSYKRKSECRKCAVQIIAVRSRPPTPQSVICFS